MNENYSALEIIDLEKDKNKINKLIIHDETNKSLAYLLTQMKEPDFPMAIGVLFRSIKPTLNEHFLKTRSSNKNNINEIINKGQTWTINE